MFSKKINSYFSKHVQVNSLAHLLVGLGIGILVNPWTGIHPVRWAGVLLVIGLALHVYPLIDKK